MAYPLKGIIMLQSNHNYEGHSINKFTKPCSKMGNVYDAQISEKVDRSLAKVSCFVVWGPIHIPLFGASGK